MNRNFHLYIVLYGLQAINILLAGKSHCNTALPRPGCSSDSMDIVFIVFRNVIVYNQLQVIYLQPSCSYICGHKKVKSPFLHAVDRLKSLRLGHITHQILCLITIHIKALRYFYRHIFCIGEHETRLRFELIEN